MAFTRSVESGQTSTLEGQAGSCLGEPAFSTAVDGHQSIAGVSFPERRGIDAKSGLRDLKSKRKIHVKVDESTGSEGNARRSRDGTYSSKQGGSIHFQGKVVVTRSNRDRRSGLQPVTPRLEEPQPRSVRVNRGKKRRYPGEESEDNNSSRKRARVRSVLKVGSALSEHTAAESPPQGRSLKAVEWGRLGPKRRVRKGDTLCPFVGCGKSFNDGNALYNHGRVHGDRPYVCDHEGCSKRFAERSKLKRHNLIHTGEKPFICAHEGCGKAFSLDFNLRSHMKTHTGEYHECPHFGCEKRYCQEYKLRAHMCKEHKGTGKTSSGALLSKEESVISSNERAMQRKERLLDRFQLRRGKLEKNADGLKKQLKELQMQLDGKSKELSKIEKSIRKLSRDREQAEQAELENCIEEDLSSSDDVGETEVEVYTEEKVVMLAHNLPAVDQGARLMDQVSLILGATPPLSPSISSSQSVLLPRMGATPPSNRPISYLSYNPSPLDQIFITKQSEEQSGSKRLTSQVSPLFHDKSNDLQIHGVSKDLRSYCEYTLNEHNAYPEPPVSQLFTCHDQPGLQD